MIRVADDGELDPAQAISREDLARCLRQLHRRADSLSTRELEKRTKLATGNLPGTKYQRVPLGRNAISEMLRGQKFPKKAFLLTFLEACGVDLAADRRWEKAWDRLVGHDQNQSAAREIQQLRQQIAELSQQLAAAEHRAEAAPAQAGKSPAALDASEAAPRPGRQATQPASTTTEQQPRDLVSQISSALDGGPYVTVARHGNFVILSDPSRPHAVLACKRVKWEDFLVGIKELQPRTVLEFLIWEKGLTYEELTREFNKVARTLGERALITERHLRRLATRERPGARPTPTTRRVLEELFGRPVEELLRPFVQRPGLTRDVSGSGNNGLGGVDLQRNRNAR